MPSIPKTLLLLCLTLLSCAPSFARADDPWTLVWGDEFDAPQLDASKWSVKDEAAKWNAELEYYAPDEVYIEDGSLVLRSRQRQYKGRAYTSGAVNTLGTFAQTYGRFEVRAKLPAGKGMWPAHWLLPADGSWPPEIDIMEMLGHQPSRIHMTNHWGTVKAHKSKGGPFDLPAPDSAADFHVYAVDWKPGLIQWSIDGQVRFESNQGVPDKPFYIILNTAIGGQWPGKPDATTTFPGYHRIDYVHVYRRKQETQPATVWLTAPSARKPLPAGNIELRTAVADTDPKTCKVEFFQGQTKLGQADKAPYTFVWKNAPPGAYDLTAKVNDALNTAVTSAKLNITVR